MGSDQETIDVSMFQYQLVNIALDRAISNEEIRHGPLPGDETNDEFENIDTTDNFHNQPQYYRDLLTRKNGNHSTPMWNQFVPSHVENMNYLVSKIKNSDGNQSTAEMDRASSFKSNNEVSQPVKISDINPSPSSSFSILFANKTENLVSNAKSTKDFQMEDIQLIYDWQDDIKDFELHWGIADLLRF